MPQWSSSTRRDRLPADWSKIRTRVLKRDSFRCQWRLPSGRRCGEYANQVDHIRPGDDHGMENLQSLCEDHHAIKSSSEGGQARAEKRRQISSRFRRVEEHPGLL